MNTDKQKALSFLDEGYTCALVNGGRVLFSSRRGVTPLLEWLQNGENCKGMTAADKVVGKAAAFLYVLLSVKEVYAKVLSEAAESVFLRFGISYEYAERVPAIRNRDGTGFCPMEQAVWNTDDPQKAYGLIITKLEELKK